MASPAAGAAELATADICQDKPAAVQMGKVPIWSRTSSFFLEAEAFFFQVEVLGVVNLASGCLSFRLNRRNRASGSSHRSSVIQALDEVCRRDPAAATQQDPSDLQRLSVRFGHKNRDYFHPQAQLDPSK